MNLQELKSQFAEQSAIFYGRLELTFQHGRLIKKYKKIIRDAPKDSMMLVLATARIEALEVIIKIGAEAATEASNKAGELYFKIRQLEEEG